MATILDMRRLRYFVAICEQGGFSRAAAVLNVAQSALSRHVTMLEEDLGVVLLSRTVRGVVPTEAGERLLASAQGVLQSLEQAEYDVRALARSPAGPALIGLPYSVSEVIGLPFVAEVNASLQAVKLRMMEAHSEDLNRLLRLGDLDVVLSFVPLSDEGIETAELLQEELVCLGAPSLLGANGDPIALDEIAPLPLIGPGRQVVMKALVDEPHARAVLGAHVRVEIEASNTLKRMLIAGMGCCVHSAAYAWDEITEGRLVARPIVEPSLRRRLYVNSNRVRLGSRAVTETRRILLKQIGMAHRLGCWPATLAPFLTDLARDGE